jgi:hypothetical protein
MEKKSLIVMSALKNKKELDAAERAARYISNFKGTKNVDLLFILDNDMLEGAILANDEYFGVKQRREFITKEAMKKANEMLDQAGAIFSKYGIGVKKAVELGKTKKILRKYSLNAAAILLLNEKLYRKVGESSSPLIIFPEGSRKLSFSNMLKGIFPSY